MIREFGAVGWQGIVLRVPKDWSLVGVSGDEKKGYFRVDSPYASAAEVRWTEARKMPDLEQKAREFLRELERATKKRRMSFTSKIKRRPPTDAEIKTGGASVGFTWRGDRNGYGRLLFCGACQRMVIVQVVSPLEEDLSGLAGEILRSACDHSELGWQTWALYDLEAAIPSEFRLERHTLMSSYILLSFKSKQGELTVERWGLAGTLLKRMDMMEWFRKDSLPDYRGFRVSIEPDEAEGGHEVLRITGRRAGIRQVARAAVRALTLRPLPQELGAYIWHCPDSNRLFAVRAVQSDALRLAREIRDRIECH